MTRMLAAVRVAAGFAAGILLASLATNVAAALQNGDHNARDRNTNGWIGNDAPGVQQFWAYPQGVHDLILAEWYEPSHDWIYTNDMDWTYESAQYLNQISNSRNLEFAVKIANETYYNGIQNSSSFRTNTPYSKAPEGSSFVEEAADHWTEMEMEMIEPYRIMNTVVYFWDQQFDAEKRAINGAPRMWSELENCNELWRDCFTDNTGEMWKVILLQ